MTTTSTRTAEVAHALGKVATLCNVELNEVCARQATLRFETASSRDQVRLLAAQVTTRNCAGAAFLATVLHLTQVAPDLDILTPDSSTPSQCPCPRWQGWLVGENPHAQLSITVDYAGHTGSGSSQVHAERER